MQDTTLYNPLNGAVPVPGTPSTPLVIGGKPIPLPKNTLSEHLANTSNPHQVTKSQVGLGNVDNTSDLDKPVSTATEARIQSALSSVVTEIPTASATVKGGVKIGSGLSISNESLSVDWTEIPLATADTKGGIKIGSGLQMAEDDEGRLSVDWSDYTPAWSDIDDKPLTFTPSTHSHETSDITGISSYALKTEAVLNNATSVQFGRTGYTDYDESSGTYSTITTTGATLQIGGPDGSAGPEAGGNGGGSGVLKVGGAATSGMTDAGNGVVYVGGDTSGHAGGNGTMYLGGTGGPSGVGKIYLRSGVIDGKGLLVDVDSGAPEGDGFESLNDRITRVSTAIVHTKIGSGSYEINANGLVKKSSESWSFSYEDGFSISPSGGAPTPEWDSTEAVWHFCPITYNELEIYENGSFLCNANKLQSKSGSENADSLTIEFYGTQEMIGYSNTLFCTATRTISSAVDGYVATKVTAGSSTASASQSTGTVDISTLLDTYCMPAVSYDTSDASKVLKVNSDGNGLEWGEAAPTTDTTKANSTAVAAAWAASTAYALDAHVTYQGNAYKCTTAHTSGSTFDSTNWTAVAVYDNPDYQMLHDGNTMHVQQAVTSGGVTTFTTVWADEYKKEAATTVTSTATPVTLSRNGVAYLDLTSATVATDVDFPTELNGYTSDMLLMVKTPSSMASLATPINWPTDEVYAWMSSSSPLLFTTADAGKTFLYTFTALPDGKFLVSRNELKGVPTISAVTVTASSTAATLTGTNFYNVTKVETSTDGSTYTTLASSAWSKTSDTALAVTMTAAAVSGTTYYFRLNGEALGSATCA